MPAPRRFRPGPPRTTPPRTSVDEAARAAGYDVIGPIDGRKFGSGGHRLIGGLAERFGPQPDELEIKRAVGSHNLAVPGANGRRDNAYMKARQRLLLTASSYVAWCAPLGPWVLIGRELVVDGLRLDLVWRDPLERVWVDEIKTHRMRMRERAELDEQVPRYLRAAACHWGDAFAGVRVCLVITPFRSYTVTAGGERIELVR
jgi:hypothetical protein